MITHVSEVDGNTYYKCEECGAIGNWKERIEQGLCHKKTKKHANINNNTRRSRDNNGTHRQRILPS
jgi:hypothetical protein